MTLHVPYTHQCPDCGAFYIPYGDVTCPRCGRWEPERFDFIPRAADSVLFNLQRYGSYEPAAWWVGGLGDHLLSLLFSILERHRRDPSRPFAAVARAAVEAMDWGDQAYVKEHFYGIAVRVYEEIERRAAGSGPPEGAGGV
jgi:hypothetical protein